MSYPDKFRAAGGGFYASILTAEYDGRGRDQVAAGHLDRAISAHFGQENTPEQAPGADYTIA